VELVVVVKFLGSQFSIIDPLKAKISSGSSSQTPAPSPPVSLVQERWHVLHSWIKRSLH